MVGDHEEVERPLQARAHAGGRGHFLATGESVGFLRAESVADHAGVGRVGGVRVGIAPEDPLRVPVIQVGRIFRLAELRCIGSTADIGDRTLRNCRRREYRPHA